MKRHQENLGIVNRVRERIRNLFIAGLAFEHGSEGYFVGDRLGIVVGSVMSALVAYLLLHLSLPKSGLPSEDANSQPG